MTLFDAVTEVMDHQARKHALGKAYVEETLNEMTNIELLKVISRALEDAKERS